MLWFVEWSGGIFINGDFLIWHHWCQIWLWSNGWMRSNGRIRPRSNLTPFLTLRLNHNKCSYKPLKKYQICEKMQIMCLCVWGVFRILTSFKLGEVGHYLYLWNILYQCFLWVTCVKIPWLDLTYSFRELEIRQLTESILTEELQL